MDFKQFSASLGDFVLGTQILKDNLSAMLNQKANGLDDFLVSESFLHTFGPSMVEELKGLVQEKDFFLAFSLLIVGILNFGFWFVFFFKVISPLLFIEKQVHSILPY